MSKEMAFLNVGCDEFEVVDETARNDIAFIKNVMPLMSNDFDLNDLFEKFEASFIDDFTGRESFIDADHVYTMYGTENPAPSITTGVGATRIGTGSGQSNVWYLRQINQFPYVVLIGNATLNNTPSQKLIKIFDTSTGVSASTISINTNGSVSYSGTTFGNLHVNADYYVLYIDNQATTLFDDAGLALTIPIEYKAENPKTIGIGFATASGRLYGYGSFIEFVKKPLSPIRFDKCVKANQIGEPASTVKSVISFTHSYGNGISNFYYTPEDNPYTEEVESGISNNMCIKCKADYTDDSGYRTEIKTNPIKDNLMGKLGGLQRIRFSADYFMDSSMNIDNGEYATYIFQIHNSIFAATGWTDAPPVTLRVKNHKLFATVSYINDGRIPASDSQDPNAHTTDEYDLCDFDFDVWHKIEVECRIGWKKNMGSRLIIKIDGVERLNLLTAVGFNIISSGGYVSTHCGIYCPEWKSGSFSNKYREILITNIRWEGTQPLNI